MLRNTQKTQELHFRPLQAYLAVLNAPCSRLLPNKYTKEEFLEGLLEGMLVMG